MRLYLIGLIFLIVQSASVQDKRVQENKAKMKLYFAKSSAFGVSSSLFPEYVFTPKDTLFKRWSYGGESTTIKLGTCETVDGEFMALTKFCRIPVADGSRGRGVFYLVGVGGDILQFDAEMPTELPIDLYKNNFVFLNKENEYSFGAINELRNEIVCFGGSRNSCFIR
ncbi:MAG: hypothetical protein ACI8ZM_000726 [Crocinitomix sp.]|jgi:hypothetical protein